MAELNELTINGSNYTFEDDVARDLATAEASRAQAAEQTLDGKIGQNTQAIANEKTRAEGAEGALQQLIQQVNTSLINYYLKSETYSKTEVNAIIDNVKQFRYQVAATLPTASADTMGIIYLIPSANPKAQNIKEEYLTILDGSTYKWEHIGDTNIDLSGYSTTEQMNAAIASALASYYTKSEVDEALGGKQNTIDDLANIRSGAQAGSTAYQKPQGGIPSTDMSQDVQTSLEKANTALQEHQSLDAYAKNDGYYEGMGVGTADNLTGQTERTDDAMYRKTGGSEEVASGTATIANIKGNTVAWNQLYKITSFSQEVNGVTTTITNNYIVCTGTTNYPGYYISALSNSIKAGHRYYFRFPRPVGVVINSGGTGFYSGTVNEKGSFVYNSSENKNIYIQFYATIANIEVNIAGYILMCDLTLIYGAGNEPTTPEQFEADYFKWFGKPLTYEDYDAGSLRTVHLDLLKTTGFNQWDEQWVNEFVNQNGSISASGDYWRTKNKIKVLYGAEYYIKINGAMQIWVATYDFNDNFITRRVITNKADHCTYTPSANVAYFIVFCGGSNFYKAPNHDICINISDTSRNGEYEPYEEHSVSLPVTTMTGKLNGEGESVVVFPDGMKSAGTVYDEIYTVGDKTYAVKRVGSVDMGSLGWYYQSAYAQMAATIPDIKAVSVPWVVSNIICAKYLTIAHSYLTDKNICITTSGTILVKDATYTDATTFKNAMNGVMLYYELATPQVYELDTFDLPKPYQVDNSGTEEQIQKSGVQGLAAILTCIYGVDAVGILNKLPQNYISEASMDNFLAQLNTVTGGTWTKTWNENTGEWDFSFQSSQVEPTNNQEEA